MSDNVRYQEPKGGKPSAVKISRVLEGLDFPTDRGRAIEYARHHGASERVVETLRQIEGRRYRDLDDLLRGARV